MGLLRVGTNCVGLHKTIIQITFLCICPNCKLYLSKLLNVQSENFLSFNWTNTFANMGLCRFGPKCAGLHLNMKNLFNLNELDYGVFDQVTRYISCQISKWFVSVKKNICHHGALSVGPNCVGLHTTINQSLFNLNGLHSGGSNHSTSFQQVNSD